MRHIAVARAARMTAGDRCSECQPDDSSFRLSDPEDWREFLQMRVNLLVTGGSSEIESFLRSARPMLVPPIRSVTARRAVTFAGTGTLILRDVNELTRSGQRALFAWMNEPTHAGMQIISTASAPLFPSVVAGIFDPDLYYRLNTICLTLGS